MESYGPVRLSNLLQDSDVYINATLWGIIKTADPITPHQVNHPVKPVLQALLLADRIYEDRETRKKIIAGIFNGMVLVKHQPKETEGPKGKKITVPGGLQAGSPYAYVSLTDVRGECNFKLQYVFLEDHRVLISCDVHLNSDDPIRTYEIVVPLPSLPTPEPGVYALELLYENELLGSHRVHVVGMDENGTQSGEGDSE